MRGIEIGEFIVLFPDREVHLVANAEIRSETRGNFPVVMGKEGMIWEAELLSERNAESAVVHGAQEEAGKGVSGVAAVVPRTHRFKTMEEYIACLPVAVVRVQHHELAAVAELETV